MVEIKKLTDQISYIPSCEDPLSSDVVLISGKENLYVFDVGNLPEITEYLNSLDKKKTVIFSHFHIDHTGGLKNLEYDRLLVGNYAKKTLNVGTEVTEPVLIEDGVSLLVFPVPSSHAKGSLGLTVNGEISFLGDATYQTWKAARPYYNQQILLEEIALLETLPSSQFFLSHSGGKLRKKETVLRLLKDIYAKRTKDEPFIYM